MPGALALCGPAPAHLPVVVVDAGLPVEPSLLIAGGLAVLRESFSQRESAGAQTICLQSCHSLWIFDVEHRRFRRLPGATSADIAGPADWQPFVGLHIDPESGAFRVILNEEHTRVLRSWLHDEPCRHCQPDGAHTGEILLTSSS